MSLLSSSSRSQPLLTAKIVVSGGFGVGKTTFVSAISEIEPLITEAPMTEAGIGVDDALPVPGKSTTTVALDFGRVALDESLVLYLFGTPGQERFEFLWDDLVQGALGAVVLVDTRRMRDCFATVDYFEERGTPFLLAVNAFDDATRFDHEEIRESLGIRSDIPIVECDARSRESTKRVLLALIERLLALRGQETSSTRSCP